MGEGDKLGAAKAARDAAAAATDPDELEAPPYLPRTTTLDDPLTTSLLAEVARRSRTVDVSPDQIAEAHDLDPVDPLDEMATTPVAVPTLSSAASASGATTRAHVTRRKTDDPA